MIVTFDVHLRDGKTQRVGVTVVSQVAFEEAFDQPAVAALAARTPKMRDITWMCWHALHGGSDQPPYKEWLATVDHMEFIQAGDPVPLETSPATG